MNWALAGLFFVLSILFLMGKGSFLIAGYNTSSKKKKAQYDEKRMCRFVGIGLLFVSIGQVLVALNLEWIYGCLALSAIGLLIALVGGNVFSKKKSDEIVLDIEEDPSQKKKQLIFSGVITVVILAFVGIGSVGGDIDVAFGEKSLLISGDHAREISVPYSDMQSVRLIDSIQSGKRVNGYGGFTICTGDFKNETFGTYKRYTYNDCERYVLIQTDQKIIVFNDKSGNETEKLYKKLEKKLE